MHMPGKTQLIAIGAAAAIAASSTIGLVAAQGGGESGTLTGSAYEMRDRAGVAFGARAIIEASGLSKDVFKDGLQAGQTINQVLTENGLDPATVQAEALANIQAALNQAVANNRIDQPRADELYAKAQEKLPKLMEATPKQSDGFRARALKGLLKNAASTIGIEPRALAQELKAGKTIAGVAAEHNIPVQTVIDNAVQAADTAIDNAVANNRISPEKAADLKSKAATKIADVVNNGRPAKEGAAG